MFKEQRPHQIVYLEHDNCRLYGEAIQVISARQMSWVRPLVLVTVADPGDRSPQIDKLVDLRFTADLIWPESLFRPALDTEVIGLLMELEDLNTPPHNLHNAHQELRCFMDQVWQSCQLKLANFNL